MYGSPEWLALPDGPEKVAGVVAAAERSVYQDEVFELQTTAEALWMTHLAKLAEENDWHARRAHHREAWTGRSFRADPTIKADIEQEWREWVGEAG